MIRNIFFPITLDLQLKFENMGASASLHVLTKVLDKISLISRKYETNREDKIGKEKTAFQT